MLPIPNTTHNSCQPMQPSLRGNNMIIRTQNVCVCFHVALCFYWGIQLFGTVSGRAGEAVRGRGHLLCIGSAGAITILLKMECLCVCKHTLTHVDDDNDDSSGGGGGITASAKQSAQHTRARARTLSCAQWTSWEMRCWLAWSMEQGAESRGRGAGMERVIAFCAKCERRESGRVDGGQPNGAH